jgi:hypothetical protein
MLIKTEKSGFVKNTDNGSIINTDNSALKAYKKAKAKDRQINNLQEKLIEMECLLQKILRNLDIDA